MKYIKFTLLVMAAICTCAAAEPPYKPVGEIPIGGEGGWDILTIDSAARRLYQSHATKVVVVDIDQNKVVGEIADTPGVHSFFPVPELQRGFSSNGKENKAAVVDLKTLSISTKLDTGASPDAMAYNSARSELYVFNHTGNSVTVIDVKEPKVITTIALDGSPEFAVADERAGRIYCNIEDKSEVAVIDGMKHRVIGYWPVRPGEEPTGIALDAEHHRLFSACQKLLVMLDTESGKVVATLSTGAGADGCAFDDSSGLIFVPCGEGITTIAHADAPDRLSLVDNLKTERGARTIALDPKTHRIYLPTAQFEPPPSPSSSPTRPKIMPNTMKLLVYGPTGGG